ncbi:multiheme c-type cytochrome [Glaciecola sp. MF2-115]|uniref:multiheme c-type cytochrome n=1 Tax=Glaciecola sp. MF2-115 TaxID=3384827 RepID=UPI0039A1CD9D
MISNDLLSTEQVIAKWLNATLLAACISGLLIFLVDSHSVWTQINSLAHVLIGFIFACVSVPYFYIHFKRTLAFRRASIIFSGILLLLMCIAIFSSAYWLTVNGETESNKWIRQLHLYSSFSFVMILVLHIIMHLLTFPKNRLKSDAGKFPSHTQQHNPFLVKVNVSFQLLIVLIALVLPFVESPKNAESQAAITPYSYSYGEHPFRPSQTETFDGKFARAEDIGNSAKCISCHQDIGEQWLSSIHRLAAADPSYVTNVDLLSNNKGIEATRYCEGCHAPIALLTGQLTPGGLHGGTPNTMAHAEGISCMSCHGISSLVHEKGVASFTFEPATDYLFAESDSPFLQWINERLIKIDPSQHAADMAKPLMQEPKMCAACHVQFMDEDMNDWGWVKMQDDYSAWANSQYAHQQETEFTTKDYTRCQDCHMPLVSASDPSANNKGQIRNHRSIGANTFIPAMRGDIEQLSQTQQFLKTNKVRLAIDPPKRTDVFHSQFHIDESLRDSSEAPAFYYLGETASINVVVSNVGVGHNFPGGTIDINEVWMAFSVVDASGKSIYQNGDVLENDEVDANAYFYGSKPVDRFGEHVWKHDLFNMVGRSFKRVIEPGESDIVNYTFEVPAWAESPMTITATLKYRKLNAKYAKWALKDQYFELPITDMARDNLQIPIKLVPKVSASLSQLNK